MRLRDRLIKGTALNLIAVVFNQGSTLFVNIIVARLLLKQGFGEYAMVQSTLLTVSMLSQLATGLRMAWLSSLSTIGVFSLDRDG